MLHDLFTDDAFEPLHAASPTAHVLDEMALHGTRPGPDDPERLTVPEADRAEQEIENTAAALIALMADTALDDDLDDVLWGFANLFHRRLGYLDRLLDDNEVAQRRLQEEQDGSEVKSVELERLIARGEALLERRAAFENLRDLAAIQFESATGSAWRPHTGSMTNRKTMTAAMIDSRDFIAAKRRAEIEPLLPAGPRIAFTGGVDCNDHIRIWEALDKALAKHPDMVLIHGGSPKGAEKIAACWADNRNVPQIVFKPDWTRHRNAAPFKRNDRMLEALPIGVIAFPGSGISQNLVDKARKMGIATWTFDSGAT
ncbi:hypothetical protein ABIE65_005160 [Constrictibacter sp. MBR-5]|jgi:hypothetical protein|uniref:DUF2493 domain-containing protein n=1 Tax=Alphaproteobacteria TaxID=28211 RepID=UPI00163CE378|nr:DUF2493 domain-containing protein [Stappia sp. 28M-7]MBC2861899.1 DUF2493 domain-containing protein [Stappia sp. 28M-7]